MFYAYPRGRRGTALMEDRLRLRRSLTISCEPTGAPLRCYWNVEDRVAGEGGSAIHGWRVFTVPGLLLIAEHHSVWETADGRIVDVTPSIMGEPIATFSPDPSVDVDLRRAPLVPSRYAALTDDPAVTAYVRAAKAHLSLLRACDDLFIAGGALYDGRLGEYSMPFGGALPAHRSSEPTSRRLYVAEDRLQRLFNRRHKRVRVLV